MSAPLTLSEALAEGWDEGRWHCIECSSENFPGDPFTRTEFGPICPTCAEALPLEEVSPELRARYREVGS